MSDLQMGKREWVLLGLLSTLWGSSFFFIEVALQSFPVFTVVFLRVAIAAGLLFIYLRLAGLQLPHTLASWRQFLLLGALRAALPISLIVWAETQIDSNLAGILNSTSPLFTVIVAHYFTDDDKLTGNRLVGIAIGMLGVALLIGLDALQGVGSQVVAQLAMLGATCSYGFAAVYGRRFKNTSSAVSATGMLISAALLILPLALLEQPWSLTPSVASIGAILGLALLSTAFAFIIWFQLIFSAGASNTAMVTFLIPIVALFLGVVILGETMQWASLLGLSFILLGLAVSQGRFFRQKLRM